MAHALDTIVIAGRRWFVDERLDEVRADDETLDTLTMDEARLLLVLEGRLNP